MADNDTDITEQKWKRRFFLLLGLVVGQFLGRLLFAVSGSATPAIYAVLSILWLAILALGCGMNFRKRNLRAATVLGIAFVLFLGAFIFVEHIGFGWVKS